jgi:putative OPT family oligopeptide transporter
MQDLKVGQVVGATPWKQQAMLVLGVLVTAFAVPPIMNLLYNAYGMGGVFPHPGMNPAQMLAAPQAGMMATVANGVYTHVLEWNMILIGMGIALVCIFADEMLRKNWNTRLPVLAVGLGIYLPMNTTIPVVIGGVLSWLIQMRLSRMYRNGSAQQREAKCSPHRHRGLLLSCGIVAGASITGVIVAIPFVIKQSSDALKIMPDALQYLSAPLSIAVIAAMCVWIYWAVMKKEA